MTATDLPRVERQRYTANLHISSDCGRVAPLVRTTPSGIAVVELVEGLMVQSDEPETLRYLAAAFWQAAEQLEAQAAIA